MATSGSIDFNLTANEIVEDAYGHMGVLETNEVMEDAQLQSGLRALNKMVKAWQVQGIKLWLRKEATLFLTVDAQSYSFPTAHATESFIETALATDEVASATVIGIDSSTGMTASDNIGIELDDGTLHWDTIATVDSSTQVTITTGITGAASIDNTVYTYTTKINRPLEIEEFRYVHDGGNEVPGWLVSRNEYMLLPNKTTSAPTIQAYYDRQISTGVFYTWPVADNVDDYIKFTYREAIEDFDTSTNNPYFPSEWLEALSFNLAVRLAPKEHLSMDQRQMLKAQADEYLFNMELWDGETTPLQFVVEEY